MKKTKILLEVLLLMMLIGGSINAFAFSSSNWNYRVPLSVNGTIGSTVVVNVNFRTLLTGVGQSGALDENSIRVVRPTGILVDIQEYNDSLFNGATDALNNERGEIRFILEDSGQQTYHIYFDSITNGIKPINTAQVINGVFETGTTGQRNIPGWNVTAAANFDAQLRPNESPNISTTTSRTPISQTVAGSPESGIFSYLIGDRTNNTTSSPQSTLLSRTIQVPNSNPGFLRFSYRVQGWDSGRNNNLTQFDYFVARINRGGAITHMIGPQTGNYSNFPFSPNYGLSAATTTRSGYGQYNGFDCDTRDRRRPQDGNPRMTIPCGGEVWLEFEFDLTPFVGQSINLEFLTHHTSLYKTWVHIDNVEWSVIGGMIGSPIRVGNVLPQFFDAIEPSISNTQISNGSRRALYTKIAGQPFSLDIIAMRNQTVFETGFFSNNVLVEILENNGTCNSLNNLLFNSTIIFTRNNPRTSINDIIINSAHRNLILRIRDLDNNITACSSDVFSIRPANITITAQGNHKIPPNLPFDLFSTDSAGIRSVTTNYAIAGNPFFINIDTNTVNYNNQFSLNPTLIDWASAPVSIGTLSLQSRTPAQQNNGNNARLNLIYSEVGYFRLLNGAIHDHTWTTVDILTGDCNNNSSNIVVNNRVGCFLENTTTPHIGRFVPYGFTTPNNTAPSDIIVERELNNTCPTSGFIYFKEPLRINGQLNAINSLGGVTRNYHSIFSRISSFNWHAHSGGSNYDTRINRHAPVNIHVHEGVINYNGRFSLLSAPEITAGAQPDNPTNISFGSSIVESDGVQIRNGTYHGAQVQNGTAIYHGTRLSLFGRIRLINTQGSEILPNRVPVLSEYFQNGSWLINRNDNCTSLQQNNFTITNFTGNIQPNEITLNIPTQGIQLSSGRASILINRPTGGDNLYTGQFRLVYNLNPSNPITNKSFLMSELNNTGVYNQNPFSIVTLGRTNRGRTVFLQQIF